MITPPTQDGTTFKPNEIQVLYTPDDMRSMRIAGLAKLQGRNRVEEIIRYAEQAGITRIGIAHCITFRKEAEVLQQRLSEKFKTYCIDCKVGNIPSSTFMGPQALRISCNPAGQAAFLQQHQTEMNISLGLCMGHDILFQHKSPVPVTTLIVKDREHKHNPLLELSKSPAYEPERPA